MNKRTSTVAAAVAIATAAALSSGPVATAAVPTNTKALRTAVTPEGVFKHLEAFQAIADANGGTRASGTPGYTASANYVAGLLEAAGYKITRQVFEFPFFEELAPATFKRTAPTPRTYEVGEEFVTMEYSGSGVSDAPVQNVDLVLPPGAAANTSTSGCEDGDFAGFTAGNVALIQRGTCTFYEKALNAQEAGASAVIIFNEGQEGRTDTLSGTLGSPDLTIPVIGTSFAIGEELAKMSGARVTITTSTRSEYRSTENVIAENRTGRTDRVVVAGAHLDSVLEGPGINDNGTGTAAILETALQMAGKKTTNRVRFAFWGAEESGLLGAEHYVANLTKRQIKNIALNLNFDMVGSPNYVRFVYDGDGSDTAVAGPTGSGNIERVFTKYFASQGLASEPTEFSGRSDYGPFIAVGIPAGGLFTGAEGIKTAEQAETYGGIAGAAYDPCYHAACDSLHPTYDDPELAKLYVQLDKAYKGALRGNVNMKALDEMSDAAAHSILTFAMTRSAVSGTARASGTAMKNAMEFKGSHRQR